MIAWLEGEIKFKGIDHIILLTSGVGYEVFMTISALTNLPAEKENTQIYVYTHVTEKDIQLFGFIDSDEYDMFKLLLKVKGIGPKVALGVLSGITPLELSTSIATADMKKLKTIQGVGKKTAELMLVELKDKVNKKILASPQATVNTIVISIEDDLRSGLENLGYTKSTVDKVMPQLKNDIASDVTIVELIRKAIQIISGN